MVLFPHLLKSSDNVERIAAIQRSLYDATGRSANDRPRGRAQFECALHLRVRRPDRIWLEVASRRKTRQFFYEGSTVTIWDRAISPALASPLSISPDVVDQAEERCSLVMPLAEFFQWDVGPSRLAALREAMYIGPTSIKGDPCDQFAFREQGVDWQIWIQRGDSPLPRKLVITATDVEARPQYTATIDWNLSPVLDDEMFTFEPSAESNRIIVLELVPQ
jgi:hypothetical protein